MQTRDFSLQPALSYKQRIEEMRQMELADLESRHRREQQALNLLLDSERQGLEDLARRHVGSPLNMAAIGVTLADLQILRTRLDQQVDVVNELAERVSHKRRELLEITKEKKALEKLKEKHDSLVTQALARVENEVMEEAALNQFLRRSRVET